MQEGRLGGLDLLRGVAALCVALFHVHIFWPHIAAPFAKAYLAVDFFFMLSGFVLTRTYHQRFLAGLGACRFMTLRLRRLWPTIAVGAVLGLLSQMHNYSPEELALFFALNLAVVPFLAGGVVFPLNGVIWSIFFELVANFVHARVLARMRQVELVVLASAMTLVMIFAVVKLESFGAASWDTGSWQGNFVAGLPRVMLSYVFGSLLYLKFGDRARFGIPPWAAPVLLPAAMILGWRVEAGWHFDLIFVLVVCPAVLMAGLASFRWANRIEQVAGDLSFPLYAVHVPILLLAAQARLPWWAGLALAILGAVVTLRLTRPRLPRQANTRGARVPSRSVG